MRRKVVFSYARWVVSAVSGDVLAVQLTVSATSEDILAAQLVVRAATLALDFAREIVLQSPRCSHSTELFDLLMKVGRVRRR